VQLVLKNRIVTDHMKMKMVKEVFKKKPLDTSPRGKTIIKERYEKRK